MTPLNPAARESWIRPDWLPTNRPPASRPDPILRTPIRQQPARRPATWFRANWVPLKPYVVSLCLILGALAFSLPVNLLLDVSSLARVFLVAVLISGVSYGLWPSLFASLISMLVYDFFFLPPVYSLSIASSQDVVNLIFFTITGIIISTLASRVRRYAIAADARALTAEKLSTFARRLATGVTSAEVLDVAAEQTSRLLERRIALLILDAGKPALQAIYPPDLAPNDACVQAVADWWDDPLVGNRADGILCNGWHFRSITKTGDGPGLIGIGTLRGAPPDDGVADPLLDALLEHMALAIERLALRDRLEASRVHSEAERLRSTLLASISHDLRNPLASIVGSASGLDRQWSALSDADRTVLLRTIRAEAERLDAFIANMLDITRIDAGVVRARNEVVFLADVLDAALGQAAPMLAAHRMVLNLPRDALAVRADATLLQQVFFNVIDNAAKYSPAGSLIRVVAHTAGNTVEVHVLDEGPGVPDDDLERVFEKFFRAQNVIRKGGTGLGLAICRGFLEAVGGDISLSNRSDRLGTDVAITLQTAVLPAFQEELEQS